MSTEIHWNWICGQDKQAHLELEGDWTTPLSIEQDVTGVASVSIRSTRLGQWNTYLATALFHFINHCKEQKVSVDYSQLPAGIQKLLKLAYAAPVKQQSAVEKPSFLIRTGTKAMTIIDACSVGLAFTGELCIALAKLFLGRARMQWKDLFTEIQKAGPRALFIVSLISFLMGLILAFVSSIPLKWFNVELYVASLIGIGMCRMMGSVMTGTVMAGRTGAAYAAELGTMQTNDEIDALCSMGIPPMEFLVLPRFLALTLMMPLLSVFSFLSGIIGGLFVGVIYLGLSPLEFCSHLVRTTRLNDLYVGLFTSFVYGILIAICGCLRGLRCGHSSEAVGQATTSAMVSSIICMVISTFLITVMTVALGV